MSEYIDKEEMHAALLKFKRDREAAIKNNEPEPPVPEYIGDCFLKIARGLAMKHNFRNYSFVNDMVSDAVYSCLRYVRSYDPDRLSESGKPTSAFSYFTQTCWYSFLGTIGQEKKEHAIKRQMFYDSDIESFTTQEGDDDFRINLSEYMKGLGENDIKPLEKKPKKKKKTEGPLEGFIE